MFYYNRYIVLFVKSSKANRKCRWIGQGNRVKGSCLTAIYTALHCTIVNRENKNKK